MAERNPKRDPAVGDIISRWGSSRQVTGIERNPRGTITHVIYDKTHRITISAWRAWCDDNSTVVSAAK
jgi:hypothetical protein